MVSSSDALGESSGDSESLSLTLHPPQFGSKGPFQGPTARWCRAELSQGLSLCQWTLAALMPAEAQNAVDGSRHRSSSSIHVFICSFIHLFRKYQRTPTPTVCEALYWHMGSSVGEKLTPLVVDVFAFFLLFWETHHPAPK